MTATSLLRSTALLIAAALVGAGGLAGESILVSTSGLAMGFGRASAVGLALFIVGYALGAWGCGKYRGDGRTWLAACALLALMAPWIGVRAMLHASAQGWSTLTSAALACAALLCAGAIQGALLPALMRVDPALAHSRGAALFFAANLGGSCIGARVIGFEALAQFGRTSAALLAGLCAALGVCLVIAWARRESSAQQKLGQQPLPTLDALPTSSAALLVGFGTAWTLAVEWIGLRHALLWLESQEATLSAVLSASLAALGLGALLASMLPRTRAALLAVIPALLIGTAWIAIGAPWVSAWAGESRFLFALGLIGPALVACGVWIPLLYRATSGEVGSRLGSLLLHEAWGALLGAPLVHALLLPHLGLAGTLGGVCLAALAMSLIVAWRTPRLRAPAAATMIAAVAVAVFLLRAPEPALSSPLYRDPSLTTRSFAEDAQFAVGVVDDGIQGERTLLTDRFRAAGTGRDYAYMRALGHLPLLLHPEPKRVAVMCLGTGTTLGAAFLHSEVSAIDVLEISPAVVAAAPWFLEVNRGALDLAAASRVHVRLGDGRRSLADSPGAFDVVTMEPLLPDSPFGVYLYTREFYAVAARSLAPGGILCQWVPPHALEPAVFEAVVESFSRAFPWSGRFLFGTQLLLIGAAAEPALEPARFPTQGSELHGALSVIDLEQPGGLLAAFRGAASWPESPRTLSDDAPWIVFLNKPRDARVLGWLGANLRRIEFVGGPAPEPWSRAVGPNAARFEQAGALLAAARIAAAESEASLREGKVSAADPTANSREFTELRAHREASQLGRGLLLEQRFLAQLRAGVAALDTQPGVAADHLLSAAELRPERADAHLYVAAAMLRIGSDRAARAALARAIELCPRALETPAGLRAARLGLPKPGP